MINQTTPECELLRAAYAAFNARDIDAAVALMTPTVAWPRAFKGGFVEGAEEVRAFWTEQWSEINPTVESFPNQMSFRRIPERQLRGIPALGDFNSNQPSTRK
jgi:hypothetical protein